MLLISHRGNTNGKIVEENHPDLLKHVLNTTNYHIEIDVWYVKGKIYLGHDEPDYEVCRSFLDDKRFICHAKNYEALFMLNNTLLHYFWHEEDDFTLTSGNYIWTYPGKNLTTNSIAVQPEAKEEWWNWTKDCKDIAGVCTKYVKKFITETGPMSIGSTKKL